MQNGPKAVQLATELLQAVKTGHSKQTGSRTFAKVIATPPEMQIEIAADRWFGSVISSKAQVSIQHRPVVWESVVVLAAVFCVLFSP